MGTVRKISIRGTVSDISATFKRTGTTTPRSLEDRAADIVNVKDFGAVGDGVTDDTLAIQSAIDALASGGCLFFDKGTYRVRKGEANAEYPNGDQPCLHILNKSNVSVVGNGATIRCLVHGQGILEIWKCRNVSVSGLTFKGYGHEYRKTVFAGGSVSEHGSFPKIDMATGGAEKGDYNQDQYRGYYDSDHRTFFPVCKNNAVDTSAYRGFGANRQEAWGTFGGGYIGSGSFGMLVYESKDVSVSACRAVGFNSSGFAVGANHFVEWYATPLAETMCDNVAFENCVAENIYSCGFSVQNAKNVRIEGCVARNIGHPNAQPFATVGGVETRTTYQFAFCDPGYGFATVRGTKDDGSHAGSNEADCPRNVQVTNCVADRCVRKGIDSHNVYGMSVVGCNISDCCFSGIDLYNGQAVPVKNQQGVITAFEHYEWYMSRNLVVRNNFLERCGDFNTALSVTQSATESYRSDAANDFDILLKFSSNVIVEGNVLKDCFGRYHVVSLANVRNASFRGNVIDGIWSVRSGTMPDTPDAIIQVSGLSQKVGSGSPAVWNAKDMVVDFSGNVVSCENNDYPYFAAVRGRYVNFANFHDNIVLTPSYVANKTINRPFYFECCKRVTMLGNTHKGDSACTVGSGTLPNPADASAVFSYTCSECVMRDNSFFKADGTRVLQSAPTYTRKILDWSLLTFEDHVATVNFGTSESPSCVAPGSGWLTLRITPGTGYPDAQFSLVAYKGSGTADSDIIRGQGWKARDQDAVNVFSVYCEKGNSVRITAHNNNTDPSWTPTMFVFTYQNEQD